MRARAGRWLPILVAIVLTLAVVILSPLRRTILRALGELLVHDDALHAADVIVLPEWAGRAGAIEAADLVHEGIADHVGIVREPPMAPEQELVRRHIQFRDDVDDLVDILSSLGVTRIEDIPGYATGTEDEGRILADFANDRHFNAIVVVSTPDHARRIARVLRRSMSKGRVDVNVFIKTTPFSPFDPDRWWQTRDGVRTEIVEVEKLLLDVIRHPFS